MPTFLPTVVRRVRDFRPVRLPSVVRQNAVLPARVVRRGMEAGLAEGMLAQVHLSVAWGSITMGLALLLGAGSFTLGILGAMPLIGALVQIPAAWWIERHGDRRRLAVLGSLGRLLWLVPAVLLFLPLPAAWRLALFLLALTCGHLMLGVSANAWTDWMTDLIPAGVRGRYFGTRNAVMSGTAMVVGYSGAAFVDRAKAGGYEPWAYALILTAAALSGGLASSLLARQPEPPAEGKQPRSLFDLLVIPFRNRSFRAFVRTFVIWNIGLGVAVPFYIAYGLTALNLPLRMLALTEVVTAFGGLLTQAQWGKLADRIGQREVLRISMLLLGPVPWFWLLATPDRIWPIYVAAALGGMTWAGVQTTQMNRLMEHAGGEQGRSGYFAAFFVGTGVPFMLASMGAGAMVSLLGIEPRAFAGMELHPYLGFFFLSGVLRLLSLLVGWKSL